MTDKMREEFEAWAITSAWLGLSDECMEFIDDGYVNCEVQAAWLAWQASREALVVDWPDHYAYTNSDVAGAAILDCRTAFGKALKVKP